MLSAAVDEATAGSLNSMVAGNISDLVEELL